MCVSTNTSIHTYIYIHIHIYFTYIYIYRCIYFRSATTVAQGGVED